MPGLGALEGSPNPGGTAGATSPGPRPAAPTPAMHRLPYGGRSLRAHYRLGDRPDPMHDEHAVGLEADGRRIRLSAVLLEALQPCVGDEERSRRARVEHVRRRETAHRDRSGVPVPGGGIWIMDGDGSDARPIVERSGDGFTWPRVSPTARTSRTGTTEMSRSSPSTAAAPRVEAARRPARSAMRPGSGTTR